MNGQGQGGFGRGGGMGRGGGSGMGRGGACVCTQCGTESLHQPGLPCSQMACLECGAPMMRKENTGSGTARQEFPHRNHAEEPITRTKPVATVVEELCIGCGRCLPACPFDAISMDDGVAKVNIGTCSGCMVCATACPVDALQVSS